MSFFLRIAARSLVTMAIPADFAPKFRELLKDPHQRHLLRSLHRVASREPSIKEFCFFFDSARHGDKNIELFQKLLAFATRLMDYKETQKVEMTHTEAGWTAVTLSAVYQCGLESELDVEDWDQAVVEYEAWTQPQPQPQKKTAPDQKQKRLAEVWIQPNTDNEYEQPSPAALVSSSLGSTIFLESKKDRVLLRRGNPGEHKALPLVAPLMASSEFNATKIKGGVAFGCFPLVVASGGQLAMIQKQHGKFWYVPGGLVDYQDQGDLWHATVREFKEETKLKLSPDKIAQYYPAKVYESLPGSPPRRHNLMLSWMVELKSMELPVLEPEDTREIARADWVVPYQFWAQHLVAKQLGDMGEFTMDSLSVFLETYAAHFLTGREMATCTQLGDPETFSPLLLQLTAVHLKLTDQLVQAPLLRSAAKKALADARVEWEKPKRPTSSGLRSGS